MKFLINSMGMFAAYEIEISSCWFLTVYLDVSHNKCPPLCKPLPQYLYSSVGLFIQSSTSSVKVPTITRPAGVTSMCTTALGAKSVGSCPATHTPSLAEPEQTHEDLLHGSYDHLHLPASWCATHAYLISYQTFPSIFGQYLRWEQHCWDNC